MEKYILSIVICALATSSMQVLALSSSEEQKIRDFEHRYKTCMQHKKNATAARGCIERYTQNLRNNSSLSREVLASRYENLSNEFERKATPCEGLWSGHMEQACLDKNIGITGFSLLDQAKLSADKVIATIKQEEQDAAYAQRLAAEEKFRQEQHDKMLAQRLANRESQSQREIEASIKKEKNSEDKKGATIAEIGLVLAVLHYLGCEFSK